jgi:hypothetical protein
LQPVPRTVWIRDGLSGDYTWFETLTEPILDESGEVVRLQTASRGVSERRRTEEALAEAACARAEFLAEVSHELGTPRTVIRGNAEVGLELDRDCERFYRVAGVEEPGSGLSIAQTYSKPTAVASKPRVSHERAPACLSFSRCAAGREQGTLGCCQSSCNSPESIFASLARGSLSYSAVTPTLG